MSFQAMTWAVQQRLPCKEKLVLLMLANRTSHETGLCFPSLKLLADECGMSRDSVIRAIKALEDAGLLTVIRRHAEGVNLPNNYRLNLPGVVADSDYGVVAHSGGGSRTQRGGVVAGCDSNQSLEPIKEPESQKPIAPSASRATPAALPGPCDASVIDLPTCRTGEVYGVRAEDVREFAALYPGVDVMAQLRAMKGWLMTNPSRRKTGRGMPAFINSWLSREQDKPRHAPTNPPRRSAPAASAVERVHAANAAAGHQPGMFPDDDHPF